jgi:hypothetical protein
MGVKNHGDKGMTTIEWRAKGIEWYHNRVGWGIKRKPQ